MAHRIMIVDDAIFFRRLVRRRFEEEGYTVVAEARDGKEAVRLAAVHRPDVIVIDSAMPLMSGVEALPLLAEASPDSHVVFLSADTAMRKSALAAGADAAISKDDSLRVCVEEVSVALGSPPVPALPGMEPSRP
jgi:two-component system chemotaxis response regulator CheY